MIFKKKIKLQIGHIYLFGWKNGSTEMILIEKFGADDNLGIKGTFLGKIIAAGDDSWAYVGISGGWYDPKHAKRIEEMRIITKGRLKEFEKVPS